MEKMTIEEYQEEMDDIIEENISLKKELPNPIEAIKFRMEQMGWTQAKLSKLTGIKTSHISEYLNRKRKINLSFIRAYHKIADATPLEVLIQDYKIKI